MVQEVVPEADRAIVYKDNLEEETLQADAEPVEKETINEAHSVVTTGKAQRSHPGYGH